MVKLICLVAVHVYTERCIDVLNVFKLNYTGNKTMLLDVSLLFLLLDLNMFVTEIWFSVASRIKLE